MVKYKCKEKSIIQFRPLMVAASCEIAFGLKREMSKGQASVKEMPQHSEPPMMVSEGGETIDRRTFFTLRININLFVTCL